MRYQVTAADTATALGSGDVPVLATPRLIAWLEAATVQAAERFTDAHQTTVGTAVRIEHRRATRVGDSLDVTAKPLATVTGPRLTFLVRATDVLGRLVAVGEIERAIVDRERFIRQVPDGGRAPQREKRSSIMARPAHTTGTDGTTLYYGNADAAHVLQVFLEMRDRASRRMAQSLLCTIRQAADEGLFVIRFHFAAKIDDTAGGSGSRRALSALAAASDVGPAQFMDYLATLFASQPFPPGDDQFSDTSVLLSLAGKVPELRSADFDRKVTDGAYLEWAGESVGQFESFGTLGTPDFWYDDEQLPVVKIDGSLALTPRQFLDQIKS